ncbi:MAG: hypothetical protein E6K17_05905 [Methanobacteriota archaeon]|nr:MAG: hypothetical protein E6K17_05905 [Euryarchaeota archaeon]
MIRPAERVERGTLTVNERLLLHLLECSANRDVMDAPFALTQEGIAQALGIRVNHVSRAVKALQSQRCVTESTAHIHGEARKRKVYMISHEGLTAAQSLARELGRGTATIKDERGSLREITLAEARKLPGGPYSFTHLLSTLDEGGILDVARLGPGRAAPSLSRYEEGRPRGESFFGRTWELATIRQWFASPVPVLLITGARGIGKSALVSKAVEDIESSRSSFWHTVRSEEGNEAVVRSLGAFLGSVGRPDLSARLLERISRIPEIASVLERDWPASDAILILDGADRAPDLAGMLVEVVRKRSGKAILTATDPIPDQPALRAEGVVQLLPLAGLESQDCRRLVPKGLAGEEFEKIYRLSRGNPLSIKLLSADALEGVGARFSPEERALLRVLKLRQDTD